MVKRKKYRNGDSIHLHCGCNDCSPSRINGVLCHEQGCPSAWKDNPLECAYCGATTYQSPQRGSRVVICHRHTR